MRPDRTESHSMRTPPMAYRVLFPLAAVFALTAIPLWLLLRAGHTAAASRSWHGHEMLFGFALCVIAGFLATRPAHAATWLLTGTWVAARVAAATASGPLAFIVGTTFPVTVFIVTAPPLLAGAKRWENRILPTVLAGLVATDVAWWAGKVWFGPLLQTQALLAATDLIALLLLLVGGRSLRAAVGGHLERQNHSRRDHRQRRCELPLAALAGGAALCDVFALETVAGALCIGAALLTLVRVVPWQLHHTLPQPHLWTLALGYLWLVPGLALKGIAQLGEMIPVTDMLHGIGIGALGTLTLVMMARTTALRTRKPVVDFGDIGIAALLVSAAALARIIASLMPAEQSGFLWLAAGTWISAFLLLLVRLWRTV